MRAPINDEDESVQIRIMSHNIRYAIISPFPGELPWADRKASLISELLYNTRHCAESFVCMQEALHAQLLDILAGLNAANPDEWSYIGVGRNDGKEQGEYSPILYRRTVWRLDRWFTTWLSPTPKVAGSKGWDAASVRILTTGVFVHAATGKTVLAMNTHLDDQGSISREESAKLILKTIEDVAHETTYDVGFLAGDLNSEPTGKAYEVLNGPGTGIRDSKGLSSETSTPYGNDMTFTGFNGNGDGDDRPKRIDFIHLGMKSSYYVGEDRDSQWHRALSDLELINKEAGKKARLAAHDYTAPVRERTANSQREPIETDSSGLEYPYVLQSFDFDSFLNDTDSHERARIIHFENQAKAEYERQFMPWKSQGCAVLPNRFDDGVYISDHRAVVGDLVLM